MSSKRNMSLTIVVVFSALLVATLFQNCAPTKLESNGSLDSGPESLKAYFLYDYTSSPNVYANTALIFPTDSVGNFASFKVMGMVAPSSGHNGTVSYSVDITDDQGNTVCVGDSGTLNSDVQNFEFQCLGSASLTKAIVALKATYNGQTETFKTTFVK